MNKNNAIMAGALALVVIGGIWYFTMGAAPAGDTPNPAGTQEEGTPYQPDTDNGAGAGVNVDGNGVSVEGNVTVSKTVTVHMTDTGFSPNPVTINKGDTVRFENHGTKPVWPASAMHPTHKVYPTTGGCLGSTFDSCKGIAVGDSWSFKFDIAGSWNYHDHINATHFGKIIVQ
jgi:plastocyanin